MKVLVIFPECSTRKRYKLRKVRSPKENNAENTPLQRTKSVLGIHAESERNWLINCNGRSFR